MKTSRIFARYFDQLNQLQQAVFLSFFAKDEQKIRKNRHALMVVMKKVRENAQSDDEDRISQLENCYEMIFSLTLLKWRIADPATFEMCETELKKLSDSLSTLLNHMVLVFKTDQKKSPGDMASLLGQFSRQIEALETLYQNTLQVVSGDPLIFLFFIQDLTAFRDALESMVIAWWQ